MMIKRLAQITLGGWLLILTYPLAYIGFLSLRQQGTYEAYFGLVPQHLTLGNYAAVNEYASGQVIGMGFLGLYRNSLIVSGSALVLALVCGCAMAYALARMRFRGKEAIASILMIGMMVPVQILLVPLFLEIKALGLYNTYLSLILPYAALGVPFVVFVMRSFFEGVPKELFEQAEIDGCSKFGQLWRIALPLVRPGIPACGVYLFLRFWNEFLLALVFIQNNSLLTVPLGIFRLHGMQTRPLVPELEAASLVMASIPVLLAFLIFNRQFVAGLTAGAIKE